MHCFPLLLSFFICLTLSIGKTTVSSHKLRLQRNQVGKSAVRSSVFQWDANVTIGGQSVMLQLDTGSSFLWVLDPSLSAWDSSIRGTYNYNKSKTAYLTNEAFSITYGGGLVTGREIIETITIGGLTFKNVPMGIGNTTSPYFIGQPFIGILGLGPPPLHANELPAPFPAFAMSSFALDFKAAGSDHEASIEFGGVDHSRYAGELAMAPLNHTDRHWAIDNVVFSVGNVTLNDSVHVVLDTGAGHNIVVPPSVAEAYYRQVTGSILDFRTLANTTLWLVPCNATLPDLTLHIGNGTATVSGPSMIGLPINTSSPIQYCNPSVQNSSATPPVLGFPFFACNYVVFERVKERIWWAGYV